PRGRGGDLSGAVSAGWPHQKRAPRGLGWRPRHLHLSRTAGGGRHGARLASADDLTSRGLSPTVAAPCTRAPDADRAVLWAIPYHAERGSGAVRRGAWATTGSGPGGVGLADGVRSAWGSPSRAVSGLWPAARVHGRHPTGRGSSPPSLRGVRRMR